MEETIDLREYFGIIKKRFWIIALITVIAAVVSGIISFFMLKPVYEAKSTLIVNTEKNEETQMITGDTVICPDKLSYVFSSFKFFITSSKTILDFIISP